VTSRRATSATRPAITRPRRRRRAGNIGVRVP
jgi:hypothetical protein